MKDIFGLESIEFINIREEKKERIKNDGESGVQTPVKLRRSP